MATTWAEIITNHGMVQIDDVRLEQLLAANAALFLRKMSLYLSDGIPLANRPPELREYLEYGLVPPKFTDAEWVSNAQSTLGATVVATGNIGYDLFACAIIDEDGAGNVTSTPYPDATYDSVTGDVTFPQQAAESVRYSMDFYTDGAFAHDLSKAQKRILGLCISVVWNERFRTNWLYMSPKIRDKSFDVHSESAHMDATSRRVRDIKNDLAAELRKYEQDMMYIHTINKTPSVWL